jgi:hypothetical protein
MDWGIEIRIFKNGNGVCYTQIHAHTKFDDIIVKTMDFIAGSLSNIVLDGALCKLFAVCVGTWLSFGYDVIDIFVNCNWVDTPLVVDRGSTVIKVLRYKSEGRWFDSRWCHGIFHWHKSFRPHYGPGADSASNRNEYQVCFLGINAAGA